MTDLLTGMLGWEAEFVKAFAWRTGGTEPYYMRCIQFWIDSAAAFTFVAWKERIFGRDIFLRESKMHIHIQRKFM